MGILPLEFKKGQSADSLGLTGKEKFNINLNGGDVKVLGDLTVTTDSGKKFDATVRIDTEVEKDYYLHGGILPYVLRRLIQSGKEQPSKESPSTQKRNKAQEN